MIATILSMGVNYHPMRQKRSLKGKKMAETKPISWEKNVEWTFVRTYLRNAEFTSPVDSGHKVSDAFLAKHGRWFLIEFKNTEADFLTEGEKYPALSQKRALSVLTKNYKTYVHQIKPIERMSSKREWRDAVMELEIKLAKDNSQIHIDNHLIIKRSITAVSELHLFYKKIDQNSIKNLEPHFFFFERE